MTKRSPIPFTKMQALGNDFVILEEKYLTEPLTPSQIRWIADRRLGVGCDQVIRLKASPIADCEISFYNADGSEPLACGNGTRCVAKYLGKPEGTIQTPSFLSHFWKKENNIQISVKEPTFGLPLPLAHGKGYPVDMGNPHLVIFTEALSSIPLEELAPTLQPPNGMNVEIAQVISPTTIQVRVWERGVGITQACGSGACAVGTLSLKLGLIQRSPVLIDMEGGQLTIDWKEGRPPLLSGPATFCFEGMLDLP